MFHSLIFSAANPMQSPDFEQNLLGHCTLLASLPKWEEHTDRLKHGQLRLLTGKKDANLPVKHERHTRYLRENWSAFTRLKF